MTNWSPDSTCRPLWRRVSTSRSIMRLHSRPTSLSRNERPGGIMTLAQRLEWPALITWYMWLIFGPARC